MKLLSLHMFIFLLSAFAINRPMPDEFLGKWVKVGASCKSKTSLLIKEKTITLINDSDIQEFGNLDLCLTCQGGGMRYSGIVLWVFADFSKEKGFPFTVQLNADEEKGISIIEFEKNNLKLEERFPFDKVKLRKCK